MFFSIVLSYLPYTLVTAFTPGPNNAMSLHAVGQNGWRRGKDVLIGNVSGFLCVMVLCALFCYQLGRYVPAVASVLKYVGAAYIAYLAVRVALSRPQEGEGRHVSFWNGFLLQFVNVKIILYAVTVYTGYVLPRDAALAPLLIHACCLTAIGAAGMVAWAAAGGAFQALFKKYHRPFNIAMALVLLYSAAKLVLESSV